MPATITSTGTFSALLTTNAASVVPGAVPNEKISTHRDTVEQRFQRIDYRGLFPLDVDGEQEVMQFVGIMAAAYSISARAAVARIMDILKGYKQSEKVEDERLYIP